MIRIRRRGPAPAVLGTQGQPRTQADRARYLAAPADFTTGRQRFQFARSIYGHPSVKARLIAMQHGKCCYCETSFRRASPGDVEHFRPKGGSRQLPRGPLRLPGYYWLAYEWTNLLFACESCNRSGKKNHFPLADESHRARSHEDDLQRERPRLVHPVAEDPAVFIGFRGELPEGLDAEGRGEATIRTLKLKRPDLKDSRLKWLQALRLIELTTTHPDPAIAEDAREFLRAAVQDNAEYAAMARAALPEYWPLTPVR